MTALTINERHLLARLLKKRAIISCKNDDVTLYLAIPNGDKRRRPVAWIGQTTLNRLLASGALAQNGQDYILAPTYAHTTYC